MSEQHNDETALMLRRNAMPGTLGQMGKKKIPDTSTGAAAKPEQVRISGPLVKKARIVAVSKDLSLPEYVEQALAEVVARDLPGAVKEIARRAQPPAT